MQISITLKNGAPTSFLLVKSKNIFYHRADFEQTKSAQKHFWRIEMKKNVAFFFAMMLAMPVASQAFEIAGDQQVAGNPETSVSGAPSEVHLSGSLTLNQSVHKGPSATARRVKALMVKTDTLSVRMARMDTATKENSSNVAGLTTAMENLTKGFDSWGASLKNHASNVALILGVVLVVCIALLGVYLGALFNRRSEEVTSVVRAGFEANRIAVEAVPERTAAATVTAIRTLDPAPFVFEAAGHEVTYQSPLEGISEGYYLELHVPKDEIGDPATYERAHQGARGVARRNCAKTMRLYFEGKFDAPEYKLQKELIEYLISTGAIKTRKLS